MVKRKLPIGGIQTFSEVRKDYDVYIDKTKHIYELASRYKAVFLSRPRRFGKSLLCSTIEALFKGQKELFTGLAVSKTEWEWKEHPVIYIDLGSGNFTENDGIDALKTKLNFQLNNFAQMYGITINNDKYPFLKFSQLITELSKKTGQVVVIIDEYDNPLLSTIDKPEVNKSIREEL
ncbi:MAG: AAA family ATPase, partial [Treponema sp.]|nr:AAA family ATPase [Treponema sp.]